MSSQSTKAHTVAEFLKLYKDEFELTASNKIKSLITKHEMPVSLDVVEIFYASKKYQMAKDWHHFDVGKFEHIVPHKSDKNKMWCQLTSTPLNKIPLQVLRHVQGKKYVRLKKEYDARALDKSDVGSDEDDIDLGMMQSLADASDSDLDSVEERNGHGIDCENKQHRIADWSEGEEDSLPIKKKKKT